MFAQKCGICCWIVKFIFLVNIILTCHLDTRWCQSGDNISSMFQRKENNTISWPLLEKCWLTSLTFYRQLHLVVYQQANKAKKQFQWLIESFIWRGSCHVAPCCSKVLYNLGWVFSFFQVIQSWGIMWKYVIPSQLRFFHLRIFTAKIALNWSWVARKSIAPDNPSFPWALLYHTVHSLYTQWKVSSHYPFPFLPRSQIGAPLSQPSGRSGEGKGTLRGGRG